MIDWTQPVYVIDNGAELFALRHPDGHVFADSNGRVMAVNRRTGSSAWVERDSERFTNTPPVQDWARGGVFRSSDDIDSIYVRFGRRNGKPFAEVVE